VGDWFKHESIVSDTEEDGDGMDDEEPTKDTKCGYMIKGKTDFCGAEKDEGCPDKACVIHCQDC